MNFGHPDTLEEVQGDLLELYDYWVQTVGAHEARWRYCRTVLTLLRPLAKSQATDNFSASFLRSDMIRNYVKMGCRNLSRNGVFGVINLVGLSLGLTTALVIFLVIDHETSYDRHHANGDRIFRVENFNLKEGHAYPGTYTGMATAFRNDVPEAELVVPMLQTWGSTLTVPASNQRFKEPLVFAGDELFRLLDYRWLAGDARTALAQPNAVVLTRNYAEK